MFRRILINKLIGKCFAIVIYKFIAIIFVASHQILYVNFIFQYVASVKKKLSRGQKFLVRNNLQTFDCSVDHIQIMVIFEQYAFMPNESSEAGRC